MNFNLLAPATLILSAAEYIIDNAIRDKVDEPEVGSVLY